MSILDFDALNSLLESVVSHYEKTAPVVSDYADDLYRRVNSSRSELFQTVLLCEVSFVLSLVSPEWDHPNYAANRLYHFLNRIGRDTTGMAGF